MPIANIVKLTIGFSEPFLKNGHLVFMVRREALLRMLCPLARSYDFAYNTIYAICDVAE
jgi:hypothetical protein